MHFGLAGLWATLPTTSLAAPSVQAGLCRIASEKRLNELVKVHEVGRLRFRYSVEGGNALPSTADMNANGVPDIIDDMALQMRVADQIYAEAIDLTRPLEMPRYAKAQFIDVFVKKMDQGNGLAYDEVVNYRLPNDGKDGQCTLRIDVNKDLARRNLTPAHELFHLYQYAYSNFKARWFLEGTARWAEGIFRSGSAPQQPLPKTQQEIRTSLFAASYNAGRIWTRLASLSDPQERTSLTGWVTQAKYTDGSLVLPRDTVRGAGYLKSVFQGFNDLSGTISEEKGWPRYNWREADQKSSEFDTRMLKVVVSAMPTFVVNQPDSAMKGFAAASQAIEKTQ